MDKPNFIENIRNFLRTTVSGDPDTNATQADYAELNNIWHLSKKAVSAPKFDADKAWDKFQKDNSVNRPNYSLFYFVAALLILLSGLWLFYGNNVDKHNDSPLIIAQSGDLIQLQDGSVFEMKGEGFIKASSDFSNLNRVVELEGNAVCTIASDPENPFVISTRLGRIKVLGTEFTVDLTGEELSVTVNHGLVEISHIDIPSLTAQAKSGETVVISPENNRITKYNTQTLPTPKMWIFRDARVKDALEEVYPHFQDKLLVEWSDISMHCKVTTRWEYNELDEIIQELSLLFDLDLEFSTTSKRRIRSLNCN
jgi:transmembrane sensor